MKNTIWVVSPLPLFPEARRRRRKTPFNRFRWHFCVVVANATSCDRCTVANTRNASRRDVPRRSRFGSWCKCAMGRRGLNNRTTGLLLCAVCVCVSVCTTRFQTLSESHLPNANVQVTINTHIMWTYRRVKMSSLKCIFILAFACKQNENNIWAAASCANYTHRHFRCV